MLLAGPPNLAPYLDISISMGAYTISWYYALYYFLLN